MFNLNLEKELLKIPLIREINFNINKYNYIIDYATIGSVGGNYTLKIENYPNDTNFCDYQYINGELIHNPIPKNKPTGLNLIYNGSEWIEQATLEEQLSHWRNELIKADRKCREEQELFGVASKESLALKQKYMDLHMQVSHELALKQEGV